MGKSDERKLVNFRESLKHDLRMYYKIFIKCDLMNATVILIISMKLVLRLVLVVDKFKGRYPYYQIWSLIFHIHCRRFRFFPRHHSLLLQRFFAVFVQVNVWKSWSLTFHAAVGSWNGN